MTKQRTTPQWQREHGSEYAVPQELESALFLLGFEDESWKNDTCPVFRRSKKGGSPAYHAVWCDHPELEQREIQGKRFAFTESDDEGAAETTLLETDDPHEIIRFLTTYFSFKESLDAETTG